MNIQYCVAQETGGNRVPQKTISFRTIRGAKEIQHSPRHISKELAKSYIEEMWFKQGHPENVEVHDDRMMAYYNVVKGVGVSRGSMGVGRASKSGPKVIFFREIKEIRINIKKKAWFVLLYNDSGHIIRKLKCTDESLARGFVDAVSYYINNLPR
jgi:hypothetical protein